MTSILKLKNEKKDYWLNEKNWLVKSNDALYIEMKKNVLETIFKMKFTSYHTSSSLNDLSLKILNDIDLLSCILNIHLVKDSTLQHNILKSALLKNKDYIEHIFSLGIFDDTICYELLKKNLFMKKNKQVAFKILTEKENFDFFVYFKKILKNEQFVLSLLENKQFNNPFCLISLPYNKKISYILLEKKGYPNRLSEASYIRFNDEVFQDTKFITKCLRRYDGNKLYTYLPNEFQTDKQICLAVLKYHPNIIVKNNSVKTVKNFIKFSNNWLYSNDFVTQLNDFYPAFTTDEEFLKAFECLSKKQKSTYLNDINFIHPLVNFIKRCDHPLILKFLETPQSDYLFSLPNNDNKSLTETDKWIHNHLYTLLNKTMLYKKLSENITKKTTVKISDAQNNTNNMTMDHKNTIENVIKNNTSQQTNKTNKQKDLTKI